MVSTSATVRDRLGEAEAGNSVESPRSAVAWAAVIGGAFAAAALSVILVALGSGLGLASISPWPYSGASATTFTAMTGMWLIVVQWLSSGFGGYLTGRLRTKWVDAHTHEVFFRDSANGFLAWAVATLLIAAVVSSAASSLIGGVTRSTATVIGGGAQGATQAAASSDPSAYFVDTLFRSETPNANPTNQDVKGETGRILAKGLRDGDLSAPDRTYLARLGAARTGLSQADAEKRVNDVFAQVKDAEMKVRQAADAARKAGAYLSIFTALSMMVGAFIAAAAGVLGGTHRDEGWGYPRP
jgi:hypothetical protein